MKLGRLRVTFRIKNSKLWVTISSLGLFKPRVRISSLGLLKLRVTISTTFGFLKH